LNRVSWAHGDVVIALSTVLRIRRTLDGAEIDDLISDLQTRKALAAEHRRRKEWRRVLENTAHSINQGNVWVTRQTNQVYPNPNSTVIHS
jgi:hypothetical protein